MMSGGPPSGGRGELAVRTAAVADYRRLYESLARAFEDDPVSDYLFPDPVTRLRKLRRNYAAIVPMLSRGGAVVCDEALRSAAVWRSPSPTRPTRWQQTWFGARMLYVMGSAISRGKALAVAMEQSHIREAHWYLALLGTHPDHQGTGLGSSVMAPILERCDEDGVLAYLESSKESNVPFYQGHGFQVTREIRVPEGPTLWAMLRQPKSGS